MDELAAFLVPGTLEAFRAELGLTYAQAGTILAAGVPGALVGSAFSVAADRYSRRVIAAGGALGFALAMVVFALGHSFAVLIGAVFVMGVASTAMVDGADVALVDMAGSGDLRRTLARSNLLGVAGDLSGPAIVAGVALAGWSWRVALLGGAGVLLVYGLLLAAAPLPKPAPEARSAAGRGGIASVVRDRRVWLIGLVLLLMNPFDETLLGFTIALLEQVRHQPAALATALAAAGLTGGVVAYTILARRLSWMADGSLLLTGLATMTAGTVAIAVLPTLGVAGAAFVSSVGLNLAWLALEHTSLTIRPGQPGTTSAVVSAIELAGFWIPAGLGAVADRSGLPLAIASYGGLGLMAMAVGVGGIGRGRKRAGPAGGPVGPGTQS